jgi:hypothetical protein
VSSARTTTIVDTAVFALFLVVPAIVIVAVGARAATHAQVAAEASTARSGRQADTFVN